MLSLVPASALAATLTVNSIADALIPSDGECTLREAIINANSDSDTTAGDCAGGSGADLIDIPAGTYALTMTGAGLPGLGEEDTAIGDLDIAGDLTLRGAGATVTMIRSDTAYDGVIQILDTVTVAAFERLALAGGKGAPLGGGAIYSPGATVTVSDCIVSASGGCGSFLGGDFCMGAINQDAGRLILRRSAVVDNPATGLVLDQNCGQCTVTRVEDSTISRNVGPFLHSIGYAPVLTADDLDAMLLDDTHCRPAREGRREGLRPRRLTAWRGLPMLPRHEAPSRDGRVVGGGRVLRLGRRDLRDAVLCRGVDGHLTIERALAGACDSRAEAEDQLHPIGSERAVARWPPPGAPANWSRLECLELARRYHAEERLP